MPSEPPLSDADLPDDPAALKARLAASRTENADLAEEVARPKAILAAFRRALFGRRSEKRDPDQLEPALEEASQELAEDRAEAEAADAPPKKRRAARRRARRGSLPPHLPRIETVVEPERTDCPGCGGALHRIGEDRAERLDVIPAQFRVPVTRRPRYARRGCADGVVQAPAPPRLIAGASRPRRRRPTSSSPSSRTISRSIARRGSSPAGAWRSTDPPSPTGSATPRANCAPSTRGSSRS